MKKLVIIAFISIFGLSAAAFAVEPEHLTPAPVFIGETDLQIQYLDPKLGLGDADDMTGAHIVIDHMEQTATLTLYRAWSCPEGVMCPMVMPAPVIIELPLENAVLDRCNTVIYSALDDQRPVDGNMRQLVIRDNTRNQCPHFAALPATEVTYKTLGGWVPEETHSIFTGPALRWHQ